MTHFGASCWHLEENRRKAAVAVLMWNRVLAGWGCVPGNKYLSSKSILLKWTFFIEQVEGTL